jgi:gamma-glutamylcyclotransferase (GGCT)/AIG2-like uncharacterized protein YtfP
MAAVFTYGTLMFEPVWRAVLGSTDNAPAPALLDGFQRFRVRGQLYPAVIEAPGQQVPGMVYGGLSDEQVAALDAFEGADYRRTQVTVVLSASARMSAGVYVFLKPECIDHQPWDPDAFEREHVDDFLSTWSGPRRTP